MENIAELNWKISGKFRKIIYFILQKLKKVERLEKLFKFLEYVSENFENIVRNNFL